jgi:hypothetical protein
MTQPPDYPDVHYEFVRVIRGTTTINGREANAQVEIPRGVVADPSVDVLAIAEPLIRERLDALGAEEPSPEEVPVTNAAS